MGTYGRTCSSSCSNKYIEWWQFCLCSVLFIQLRAKEEKTRLNLTYPAQLVGREDSTQPDLSSPGRGRFLHVLHLLLDDRAAARMSSGVHSEDEHGADANDKSGWLVDLLRC